MPDQPFTLLYDANGAPVTAAFAPVTGRPATATYAPQGGIVGLGLDYAGKAQAPKIDSAGNQYVVAQTPAGTPATYQATSTVASTNAVYGPVMMGLQSATVAPLQMDGLGNLAVVQNPLATFSAIATAVVPSTSKSCLALVNKSTAGSIVRLVAVYSQNTSTTSGGLLTTYSEVAFELRPITGVTATGTTIGPLAFDSADTLDAGITCYTGATVAGDTKGAYRRWVTSNDGASAGSAMQENITADMQGRDPWLTRADASAKHITVRPGAGIHLKVASTSTQGALDVTFVFTVATT